MDFVKLPTRFYNEPRLAPLSAPALALYVCATALCGELESDGVLCEAQLLRLPGAKALDELVKAKIITRRGREFRVPDFLEHQISKTDLDQRRQQARGAAAASVLARAGNGAHR
jgi:hypothetical protein